MKNKLSIWALAVCAAVGIVGGVAASWVGSASVSSTVSIGKVELKIGETSESLPMLQSLNWVDVDCQTVTLSSLNGYAESQEAAKATFTLSNACSKDLDVVLTLDDTAYSNAAGVGDCVYAWLYVGETQVASSTATSFCYETQLSANASVAYTLFMIAPKSLMNGFAAEKTFQFDLLATGSLPVTLVGVSVSEAKNGVVEIDYGTEFSDLKQAMTVTADYSDGSQLELSSEDYTLVCEGYKSNGGTFSAVISYLGEDLSVTLDVAEVEGLSVDNEKITVSYGTTLSDIKEKITVYKTFTHGDPVKLVGEDFQLICSEYKATVPGTYWAYLYDKNGDYEYCITIEVKSS